MLKMRPARLRGRIGLILLLHAMIMIGIVTLFVINTDSEKVAPQYRVPDPDSVALITAAFEKTPPATHPTLARAFSSSTQKVALRPYLPPEDLRAATPDTWARYRAALGRRLFRIEAASNRAPVGLGAQPIFSPDVVRVSVALPDGQAMSVEQMATTSLAQILDNRTLFLLAIALADLIVVLWLASQTTRPVERLARAIREDRLEDLAFHGPREIVELADSFRQLHDRLHDLIQERTRMLAAIAHDYRTYLTRLALRTDFIEDPKQRSLAASDLEEMEQLLSDTLTFARDVIKQDSEFSVINVHEEIKDILCDRPILGQEIAFDIPGQLVLVRASHLAFQRMMANLLDNAMRYGGGHVTVRVQVSEDIVRIMVEDEGPGVQESSLHRLLRPFERGEPSRARHTGGVGLGLSIVHALAQRNLGDLVLENRSEGGFRATLSLVNALSPGSGTCQVTDPDA